MIYKISAVNMPAAFNNGGQLHIMSSDGIHGLFLNLTDTSGINVVDSYEDSELDTLLSLPEWQQPCPACEV